MKKNRRIIDEKKKKPIPSSVDKSVDVLVSMSPISKLLGCLYKVKEGFGLKYSKFLLYLSKYL